MRTLVLNSNYLPLGSISWQKAITLLFSDKVEIVEEYPNRDIRSASMSIKMPAVVRLLKWVHGKKVGVRFNKTTLYLRDHGKCAYCQRKVSQERATYDHVLPKSRGGKTDFTNIVLACYSCNQKKDRKTPHEAGMALIVPPAKPEALPIEMMFSIRYKDRIPEEWKNWINLK